MRLVSYQSDLGPRVGAVRAGAIVDLNRADPSLPTGMIDLLILEQEGLDRARAAAAKGEAMPLESVKLLAPVPQPEKIICVGLNYADHARETGKEPPPEPVICEATSIAPRCSWARPTGRDRSTASTRIDMSVRATVYSRPSHGSTSAMCSSRSSARTRDVAP